MPALDASTRRWPRPLWVPGLAGLIVLGLVLGLVLLRDSPAERTDADEPPILIRAADALSARESAPLRIPWPDEWLFVRTARVWNEGRDVDTDEWIRADYERGARPSGGGVKTFALGGTELDEIAGVFPDLVATYRFYRDLPDDPGAVRGMLYDLVADHELSGLALHCHESGACSAAEAAKWDRDSAVFFLVNGLFMSTVPPPKVAAKLYRALAGIPGVEDAGTITDTVGKKALAVRWHPPVTDRPEVDPPETPHILIDPKTFQYRGDYIIDTEAAPGGAGNDGVTWSDLILTAGFVGDAGEFPRLRDRPDFPAILHNAADRLAASASPTPPEPPRPDQWRYLKVAREWIDGPDKDREQWMRVDFGRIEESVNDGPVRTIPGRPDDIEAAVFTDLADIYAFYRELPTEPAAALEAVYAKLDEDDLSAAFACTSQSACARALKEPWPRHGAAYELIHRLLYAGVPPPHVQATLFRALAAIPGVRTIGIVEDVTGTKTKAIVWAPPVGIRRNLDLSRRVQVLIDAETLQYRGYRELDLKLSTETQLAESHIVLATGFVDEVGERR